MLKISFDELRKNYPSPISSENDVNGTYCYCVGGALCLTLGRAETFPTVRHLAIALTQANPALPAALAERMSSDIINENDIEEFESAWEVLRIALNFGHPSPTALEN